MKKRRNFWRAWHDKRHHWWEEHDHPPAEPDFTSPPPGMAKAWRKFFHEFMGTWPEQHWAFGGRRFSPWHQGLDAFNPFVASLLSKGGGLLPLYVMHLLSEEPRYGNEIMDLIAERTGGQWVANPGAIYPLMNILEQQGFIEGEWPDPRKRTVRIYHLTKDGQQEMERLNAIVRPKLEEAIGVLQGITRDLNGQEGETAGSDGVIYL